LEFRTSLIIVTVLMTIFTSTTSGLNFTASAVDSTMTKITPNPASSPIGKPVTFKATVPDTAISAKITPTGTVSSWSDGGAGGTFSASTCTLTLVTTGVSACTVTYTPAKLGTITISATYSGDSLHAGSSGTSTLTSTLRTTSTTVLPNPASGTLGKPINFKAKVADSSPGTKITPTGTVSWSDGGAGGTFSASTCTLTLVTTGVSACTVTYTPAKIGPITITGTYSGDTNHTGGSGTSSLASNPRSTATTVQINQVSVAVGQTVTIKGKVADSTGGTKITPTGTVSWSDGGAGGTFSASTCTLTLVTTGVSACTVTYTPAKLATITINATYSADTNHMKSSGTSTFTTTLRTSSTSVQPNPASGTLGNTLTFKGRVADSTGGIKSSPIGTVSWSDGGAGGTFGSSTCTLASVTTGVSECTVGYTPAKIGPITITGTYSGDSMHTISSGTSTLTVT
jgi:trimeric autotransporter adhesin